MNKRVAIAVIAAMLVPAAYGQFHGVPAGATSLSDTHGFSNPPGVPASATSITPRNFSPSVSPSIRWSSVRQPLRIDRDGRHRPPVVIAVPVPLYGYGYSYGYYPYLNTTSVDTSAEMNAADYTVPQTPVANYSPQPIVVAPVQQPPQVIVIDNRGVRDASADEKEQALATSKAAKEAKPVEAKVEPETPRESDDVGPMTVLVFRDGSRKEVKNYAIMGKELIVLGSGSLRRVQLADLDLPATAKENDVRGLDFKLP
jgi:hypothetical protein